jgi:hypothetical protein
MKNLFDRQTDDKFDIWNMNILFLKRLDTRIDGAEVSFIDGDLIRTYWCLEIVYSNIYWFLLNDLNDETNKDVAKENKLKIEDKFKRCLTLIKEMNVKDETILRNNKINLQILLTDLFFILNVIMIEYGLVFSKNTEKTTRNKAVEEI